MTQIDINDVKEASKGRQVHSRKKRGCFSTFWWGVFVGVAAICTVMVIKWSIGNLLTCKKESADHLTSIMQEQLVMKNSNKNDSLTDGMLPKHVRPRHYNLTLKLFLSPEDNFTTEGNVEIDVVCVRETQLITMNAKDLKVRTVNVSTLRVNSGDGKWYETRFTTDPQKQLLLIHLDRPLQPKTHYLINISFDGFISRQPMGLYHSSYKDDNGKISWIASTQLEPSDARRVFPSFDEPCLKSTYQLNVIRPRGYTSLSNMPSLRTQILDSRWEKVSYLSTPPMASYLLALVVGNVVPFKNVPNNGVQVWSTPNLIQYGEYAYSLAPKLLKFYGSNIDVPYNMPKTDLVAVPSFLFSAMENWGLIIFDETALLLDPSKRSTEDKIVISLVIAHEIAHQWFGNLVTLAWWDNLWLNEGFSTYYQYLGIAAIEPDWNIEHHMMTTIYEVMQADSLSSTRAMSSPAKSGDILELFDDITYVKGGAVIRMLHHFLGDDIFRFGLKNYMIMYSYKSVVEEELWQKFSTGYKQWLDVQSTMETWTRQSGYPLLHFERNYTDGSAVIAQESYNLDRFENQKDSTNKIWAIPVTFTDGIEQDWATNTDVWLTKKSGIVDNLPKDTTWVIANIQQVGYYRVNYDIDNWNLLLEQLIENHEAIHVINRAQLLNDALTLARTADVPYALALNLTKYLYEEKEYLPWQAAFASFKYIDFMLSKTEAYGTWKEYMLQLMTPIYDDVGWTESTDEKVLAKLLRKSLLVWMCKYDHDDSISQALEIFNSWKNGTTDHLNISDDIREVALCTGVAKGRVKDWEFVWKSYVKASFKTEKKILLKSLTCAKEPWLLERLLKWTIDPESHLSLEDGSSVFVYVSENVYGRDLAYNFFKKNLDDIVLRYGANSLARSEIVNSATVSINADYEIRELQNILKRRRDEFYGVNAALHHVIGRSLTNVKWMKYNYGDVRKWLQNEISV